MKTRPVSKHFVTFLNFPCLRLFVLFASVVLCLGICVEVAVDEILRISRALKFH